MLKHDPNTQYVGLTSDMRTMLFLQAIGLAIMDFVSDRFKRKWPLYTIGMIILIYSIAIGVKANLHFNDYLNYLKTQTDLEPVYKSNIKYWMWWVNMFYVYLFLFTALIVIIIVSFYQSKFR